MVHYGGIPDRKVDGTINPSPVNKYFNILTVYWLSFSIEKFWTNFAKNSIILNNLFAKWKEWIYVGGTVMLITLIIITIWFLINNIKSIKTK